MTDNKSEKINENVKKISMIKNKNEIFITVYETDILLTNIRSKNSYKMIGKDCKFINKFPDNIMIHFEEMPYRYSFPLFILSEEEVTELKNILPRILSIETSNIKKNNDKQIKKFNKDIFYYIIKKMPSLNNEKKIPPWNDINISNYIYNIFSYLKQK